MTGTPREPDASGSKIVLEIELDDHIANGLHEMVFKTQLSGHQHVFDARQWVNELIDRYKEAR